MSLYTIISKEINARKIYVPPYSGIVERFGTVVGGHILNLANTKLDSNYHCTKDGSRTNFRNHMIYMAPSGFGKSMWFKLFFHHNTGLLLDSALIDTGYRTTFSPECWLGTMYKTKEGVSESSGVLQQFLEGIVSAPEFMQMKLLMAGEGITNQEAYLLEALDSDSASKDLSYGTIQLDRICTTVVGGMRPCNLTFVSGLGRRFTWEPFFPSRRDAMRFDDSSQGESATIYKSIYSVVSKEIEKLYNEILSEGTKTIDFTSINDWLKERGNIPHFDKMIYRRLAIGLSVAKGTYPEIVVDTQTKLLLESEFRNRLILRSNIWKEVIVNILRDEDGNKIIKNELLIFLQLYYQLRYMEARDVIGTLKREGSIIEDNKVIKLEV